MHLLRTAPGTASQAPLPGICCTPPPPPPACLDESLGNSIYLMSFKMDEEMSVSALFGVCMKPSKNEILPGLPLTGLPGIFDHVLCVRHHVSLWGCRNEAPLVRVLM